MNQFEQVLKNVTSKTIIAFAKAMDRECADWEQRMEHTDTTPELTALCLEIEKITKKILRKANLFPGQTTHNIRAWRQKNRGLK